MKNIEKINALVKEYQSMRSIVAEGKAEMEAISGALKALLEEEGLDEYSAPTGHCVYREVVSYPIDTRALKSELPEIASRYSIARITRPLKIA